VEIVTTEAAPSPTMIKTQPTAESTVARPTEALESETPGGDDNRVDRERERQSQGKYNNLTV